MAETGSPTGAADRGADASAATDADPTTDRDVDPLLAWSVASVHAALVLVVPLAGAHAVAPVALGDLLGGLNTAVGVGFYLVLWGSTWWTNRRYLAASTGNEVRATLVAGAKWGAVTGAPLLGCVVLAVLVATNPVAALLVGVAGGVVAPLVGATVGVVLAGVDLGIDRLADALVDGENGFVAAE